MNSGAAVTLMKALYDVYANRTATPPTLKLWKDIQFYGKLFDSASLAYILKDLLGHSCSFSGP